LNIIERRRWVRSYLKLGDDDRHGVLENSPLSCHFAMRKEGLFMIGVVCFKHLLTLLHQGLEGGLEDVALVEVDPLWPEFPPFMLDVLEVVDSPTESPKCVCT
jgi:hypothetical protein